MDSNVLIIDDDVFCSTILNESFTKVGYTNISIFNRTDEFLKYLRSSDVVLPKVLIMDYHMPFLNGFQLLAYLKKHPAYANIKVIIYSGSANENEKRIAIKAGAFDFVEKKYNQAKLLAFTNEVIQLAENDIYHFESDVKKSEMFSLS